jgi:fatty acid desaturase
MFNDIRFIAAVRTLAVVAAAAVGIYVAIIYGGNQFIFVALIAGALYLFISGVYSTMLYNLKHKKELETLSDDIGRMDK